MPERSSRTSTFLARIAATCDQKSWQRVRVIDEPPTDYERFELAAYQESAAVGEEVRIVMRSAMPDLRQDFWLFDDTTAMMLEYDDSGRLVGESSQTDSPEKINQCRAVRDRALAASMPLTDYLTKYESATIRLPRARRQRSPQQRRRLAIVRRGKPKPG